FGAYELVEPLGAGGMGSVWLARRSDGHFEGMVAVKLLSAALLGAAGAARFRREGTILARLKHPHIAQLIDAGALAGETPVFDPGASIHLIDDRTAASAGLAANATASSETSCCATSA
ncbi:MAG TPA: hypothetical protein VLQ45_11260, partial [Thermoanaerobaculia bacterium]|nr:hypothetical protein [Thermoanaerobaculia bacterium]